MLQTLFFVFLVAFGLLHVKFRYSRAGKLISKIPGPKSIPVLGNAIALLFIKRTEIWGRLSDIIENYYPIFKVTAPNNSAVVISDPDDIEILLKSRQHITKSHLYKFLKTWLGLGLLTSTGEYWSHHRKMLTPAFHFTALQKYVDIMSEYSQRMVTDLKSSKRPVTIKLTPFMLKYSLHIICDAALGAQMNDDDGERFNSYLKAITQLAKVVVDRFFNVWNPLIFNEYLFNNFTPKGWKHKQMVKVLHNFTTRIINERKDYHDQTNGRYLKELKFAYDESSETIPNDNEKETNPGTAAKRLAMIDVLIQCQKKNQIDDIGMREDVDTVVFGGHDTSASTLTFAIQLFAQHPDIQSKAREEVNSIWASCNGRIGMEELKKMSYLERCIKETLRLFPSVPILSRLLTNDLQLKNYLVPEGSNVVIFVYNLHRNPRNWPDALKFDPDRFLPERSLNRHAYSYIPFSAGPRNCIGQKFAMMELKMICAYILQNFHLEPVERFEDFEPFPDMVLKSQFNIHATFIPIES